MTNRIRHLVMGEQGGTRMPKLTSMLEPCEVYVPREHLISLLEMSLEKIEMQRGQSDTTPARFKETEMAIRQRRELLEWTQEHPDEMIVVALYPESHQAR